MPHIVILDDDYNNSKLISMLLEMDGFKVTVSPKVDQAKYAAQRGIDAFVIDCYLNPGEDGLDFVREIRRGGTAAPTNILVIMTSGDDRMREASQKAGADIFMLKPFSPTDLSRQLAGLLK